MKLEDYLAGLSASKEQDVTGNLLGNAIRDKEINAEQYQAMCNIALSQGFKFVNIQLP